jgi:hypothetical protein
VSGFAGEVTVELLAVLFLLHRKFEDVHRSAFPAEFLSLVCTAGRSGGSAKTLADPNEKKFLCNKYFLTYVVTDI